MNIKCDSLEIATVYIVVILLTALWFAKSSNKKRSPVTELTKSDVTVKIHPFYSVSISSQFWHFYQIQHFVDSKFLLKVLTDQDRWTKHSSKILRCQPFLLSYKCFFWDFIKFIYHIWYELYYIIYNIMHILCSNVHQKLSW